MLRKRCIIKIGLWVSILWILVGIAVSLLSYREYNLNIMGYTALILMPLIAWWVFVFLKAWKDLWDITVVESNLIKAISFNLILKPVCATIYVVSFLICCLAAYYLFLCGYFMLFRYGFWGISTAGIFFGVAVYMFLLFRTSGYNLKVACKLFIEFDRNKIISDLLAFGFLGVICYLGIEAFFESNLPNTIMVFTKAALIFLIESCLNILACVKNLLQDRFVLLGIVIIWYVNVVKNEILRALR